MTFNIAPTRPPFSHLQRPVVADRKRIRLLSGALGIWICLGALILAGCGGPQSGPGRPAQSIQGSKGNAASSAVDAAQPVLPAAGSGRGGYYQDDGPGDNIPAGLVNTPDALPTIEPYNTRNNRPYTVFGKTYRPLIGNEPYSEKGVGSWYGKKFHNAKTASGEKYDMYAMTAAHTTLPIPSYARVTNLANGVSVIVRINDRGPFKSSRIIDLSYTAALKLGYLKNGSAMLQVDRLLPTDIRALQQSEKQGTVAAAPRQLPPEKVVPSALTESDNTRSEEAPADLVAMMNSSGEAFAAEQPVSAAASPSAASGSDAGPAQFTETIVPPSPDQTVSAEALAAGFYLQLGAFGQYGNAVNALEHLRGKLPATAARLQLQTTGALTKVVAGPYGSREEAERLRDQIGRDSGTLPVIVQQP